MQSKTAFDSFNKKTVVAQLVKRANVDWSTIGQGALAGGLGGGALGGLGSYLFSKEKDGTKRSKDALSAALTGAGLGAATGAGAGAAWHLLPSVAGGKPDTSNSIWNDASTGTKAMLGAKATADVAPLVGAASGAYKDFKDNAIINDAMKKFDPNEFRNSFKDTNAFSDIIKNNASVLNMKDLASNTANMDAHISNMSRGNPLHAARQSIDMLEQAGIGGKEMNAIMDSMRGGNPLDLSIDKKLSISPHLGALAKDVAVARDPGIASTLPGQLGFNPLNKEVPRSWNPYKNFTEAWRQRILDPEAFGHTAAKTLSHMPNTISRGVPTAIGSGLANLAINKWFNTYEPQRMANMASMVDANRPSTAEVNANK